MLDSQCRQIVFEEVFAASDSCTLEQLKELSSRRRLMEDSINESSSITDSIAREMSGGLTTHSQRVICSVFFYYPHSSLYSILESLIFTTFNFIDINCTKKTSWTIVSSVECNHGVVILALLLC